MDPWIIFGFVIFGVYLLLRYDKERKEDEKAKKQSAIAVARDNKLYENIQRGMREYRWRLTEDRDFKKVFSMKHGDIMFETSDIIAYKLKHFAETRTGFYFKDINEYGIYSFFVGNDPENDFFETFYRSNAGFDKEDLLIFDND